MNALRIWLTGRIDAAGIWLVYHGHITAAAKLWQACGMWDTQ